MTDPRLFIKMLYRVFYEHWKLIWIIICKLHRFVREASKTHFSFPFPTPCSILDFVTIFSAYSKCHWCKFRVRRQGGNIDFVIRSCLKQCFLLVMVAQVGIIRLITSKYFGNAWNKIATRLEQCEPLSTRQPTYILECPELHLHILYVLSCTYSKHLRSV